MVVDDPVLDLHPVILKLYVKLVLSIMGVIENIQLVELIYYHAEELLLTETEH